MNDLTRDTLAPWERPADTAQKATGTASGPAETPEERCPVPLTGTLFGLVPYDLTLPTPEKIREHVWNPQSDKVFGPHLFGAGWSVNLGALAAKLGVIRPDADPLADVPTEAWAAVVAVPAALGGISALTDEDLPPLAKALTAGSAFAVAGAVLAGLLRADRTPDQR